jgi:hypothetical protein
MQQLAEATTGLSAPLSGVSEQDGRACESHRQAPGTGMVDNKRCSSRTLHVGSNMEPTDVQLWVDCKMMICAFVSICKYHTTPFLNLTVPTISPVAVCRPPKR